MQTESVLSAAWQLAAFKDNLSKYIKNNVLWENKAGFAKNIKKFYTLIMP